MLKINKIEDKETKIVVGQDNCTKPGAPYYYQPGQDCLQDCTAYDKPRYWESQWTQKLIVQVRQQTIKHYPLPYPYLKDDFCIFIN